MAIFSPGNCQKIPFLRAFLGLLVNIRDMSLFSVSYILIGPRQLDLATAVVRRTQIYRQKPQFWSPGPKIRFQAQIEKMAISWLRSHKLKK